MNWYYGAVVALICLTVAIPIWAASRVEADLGTAPGILPTPERADD